MLLKENSHGDQFPVGMRVLAIDANFVCLKYLVTVLQQCRYKGFSFFLFLLVYIYICIMFIVLPKTLHQNKSITSSFNTAKYI